MTEDTKVKDPTKPSPDRAWERPPPGHPEDAEGPWWAHDTRKTNPHWPYEGPAQGMGMGVVEVKCVPGEQATDERFTIQWSGVVQRNCGYPQDGTDDSDRFDFNTGDTSVEKMILLHPIMD